MNEKWKTTMTKVSKNCVIHLSEEMHKAIKICAIKEGKKLHQWVADVLDKRLNKELLSSSWLCQGCGKWDLKETRMSQVGRCQKCGKEDLAVFPVWERK